MQKITAEELKSIPYTSGIFERTRDIREALDVLEKGEATRMNLSEWPVRSSPSSSYFNTQMKPKKFRMRRLEGKKELIFIRVE